MTIYPKIVTLPLTSTKSGIEIVPQRSGLNWGQRPGRNQNQAYIAVPVDVQRSGFFPDRGEPFIIECDDGEKFKCVRSQASGKAIESTTDNSLIGLYFRKRLSVRPGHMITIDHLHKYGRVSVDVRIQNDYLFFLDFSVLIK